MELECQTRVLLVDDRPANLLALEAVLEPLGALLVRAASGHEALEKVARYEFAAILLDVQMPGIDGFQTAFMIRKRASGRPTPIILLTATDIDESQLLRGYAEGAVDVLGKPFRPDVLRSKVRVFVDLYESNARLRVAERKLRKLNQSLERRVDERTATLEEGERRARILAAASAALADSLDYRTVLRKVASLPVPELADWCAVHGLDERGAPSVVAIARAGDDGNATVSVEHLEPGSVEVPPEVQEVLTSGRSRFVERLPDAAPTGHSKSAMSIPIRARGKLLGAVTLAATDERRVYGEADLRFAEELARRAAATLENALLYHAAQEEIILRRRAEDLARRSQVELEDFCENAPVPLHWLGPDGAILWANQAELDLLGYSRDEYVGRSVADFYADPTTAADFLRRLAANETLQDFEARLRRKDGHVRDVLISSNVLWDNERFVHTRCFTRDITERKRMEEALAHGAYHDALTGLPNRVTFREQVEKSLAYAERRPGYGFALLFIDLDRFKQVNDTLGHAAGDELLVSIALRLEDCIRPGDTVARLGGDEFTVLLDDVSDSSAAVMVAERILDDLGKPFSVAGKEVVVTPSIGISMNRPGLGTVDEILHEADQAMYMAKSRGGAAHVCLP